jgi:hypothetical protein
MYYFILAASGGRPIGSINEDDGIPASENPINRSLRDGRRSTPPPASCDATGDCSSSPVGSLFGGGPNSGYLCDSGGGGGCGNDIWIGLPQAGFGDCGPGGCGGPSTVLPLNPIIPPRGPYANNVTSGNVDPFGGGPNVFLDPDTGKIVDIGDDRKKWPERIRHAADLNDAYSNREIKFYPFNDPNWATKSVEDLKNSKPPPADTQTAGGRIPILGRGFAAGPYSSNATVAGGGPASEGPGGLGVSDTLTIGNTPASEPPASTGRGLKSGGKTGRFGIGSEPTLGGPSIKYNPNTPGTILNQAFGTGTAQPPETTSGEPGNGTPISNRRSRIGIGTDTSLGGVGGRSGQMQIAKNFGLQGIFSYTRVNFEPQPDNSDLTSYVSKIIFAVEGHRFASGLAEVFLPPTTRPVTLTSDRIESNVPNPRFRNTSDGKPVTLPPDPENGDTAPGIAGALTENVPNEFRAATIKETVVDGRTQIRVFLPRNGPGADTELGFASREAADAMINALQAGKTDLEAYNAGRAVDARLSREARQRREIAEDTGIITSPSGLASASEPGARTSPPPRPAPPAGKSIDVMEEALFKGSVYKLEIIQTPDGRTLAVGTGEHAGHVFGETKQGAFGWRREGPWTPPPAPAPFVGNQRPAIIVSPTPTDIPPDRVVTDLPGKIEPGDKVTVLELGRTPPPGQNDNVQIRVQIANSDRNHMTQPGKLIFDPSAASGFSGTGR